MHADIIKLYTPKGGRSVLETSLSRAHHQFHNKEMALLTASKSENSPKVNYDNNQVLRKLIRQAGLGYVSAIGRGQEAGSPPVSEPSFMVVNCLADGGELPNFRAWAISLGKRFNQYCILYGNGEGRAELINTTPEGNEESMGSFENFKAGTADYYTMLRGNPGKAFHFEAIEYAPSSGWFESFGRRTQGEVIYMNNALNKQLFDDLLATP